MSTRLATAKAVIALGSNLGDRRANLETALARLAREPGVRVLAASSWHETDPVGGPPGQARYLNGVAQLETELSPRALLTCLLQLERLAGRERQGQPRNGARRLDLDLLFHGDARLSEPGLELPHPRLEDRSFVLEPLCELEPERVLGRSGLCVRAQLSKLTSSASQTQAGTPAPAAVSTPIVRLDSPAAAAQWCRDARAAGRSVGFVPTMGALHVGHLELVRRSARENDLTVASVFVNPLQFNDPRDFARYPRDLDGDTALLSGAGASMVFTGTLEQFFPGGLTPEGRLAEALWLEPGPSAEGLEGKHRPGHFRGVATIVGRLFDTVEPQRAYFGQKDFQQSLVVKDLARSRGRPEIVVCPTSREVSGLARSSRNQLLSAPERERAAALFAALCEARDAWLAGERGAEALDRLLAASLAESEVEVEYAEVRDPERWSATSCSGPLQRAVALVAARVGTTRLIDNLRLDEPIGGVR